LVIRERTRSSLQAIDREILTVPRLLLAFIAGMTVQVAPPADGASGGSAAPKVRALILTGANNHPWKTTTPHLKKVLEEGGYIEADVSTDPEAPILSDAEKLKKYQVVILNFNRSERWAPEREANLLRFVRGGGGLVVVHAADNAFPGWDEYDKLVGGTWRPRGTSFPERGSFHADFGPVEVTVVDRGHPITEGIGSTFSTQDEMYANLKLQPNIHVLAQGMYQGKPQPLLFVSQYGKGRMFQTALGHDLRAMSNPRFVDTLIRGTRWAAGQLD
jgi:type 1 glutamine amidotransferase